MTPFIDVRDLVVERAGAAICTVSHLEVAPGARLGLIGPNGSGKSTLLRVLAGLTRDFTGRCFVAAPLRERTLVHQEPFLFRGSVLSNTTYGMHAHGVRGKMARDRAVTWLERLGVTALADRGCAGLSAGERRRVALARALAREPRLLLLDEPLSDLDPPGIATVVKLLTELQNTTVVLTSPGDLPRSLLTSTYELSGTDAS